MRRSVSYGNGRAAELGKVPEALVGWILRVEDVRMLRNEC